MKAKDNIISRIFSIGILCILIYWCYKGIVWIWNWYFDSGGYTSQWWPDLGGFLWRNISIVVVIYGIACLQASGLAELKFRKNFLKAFGLALILTPPGMMIVYGHKK